MHLVTRWYGFGRIGPVRARPFDRDADAGVHTGQLALRAVDDRRRRAGVVVQLQDDRDRENQHQSTAAFDSPGGVRRMRLREK